MLAVAGDLAAGKTTVTMGRLGHPDFHYLDILESNLYRLATGQPILKPVYDHRASRLARPLLVEPTEFVIVEGLLPLHTERSRACFDITVYLDPPEPR